MYVRSVSTKDHRNTLIPRNKFNRQQDNNTISNSAVYEIMMYENGKSSDVKESPEDVESDFDENELSQI